ncbi:MAG: glycosyltransferase family 4 protein [Desulfomonilia bacterium]|jgi:glycosyltransferase involved in cell wall biosynthesis|nr:glycosyltransferase family 4 protein [Desulfomonilia bacterium]
MRIAQVAPLFEPVPPELYGGSERVVSHLTEELVRRGHSVTLFASGDSRTRARLYSVVPRSLRLEPAILDPPAFHFVELAHAFARADEFDVIHCHNDYLAFPFAHSCPVPCVHTLHGRMDFPHWSELMAVFSDMHLVSISNDQRRPLSNLDLNWADTIYHGLPESYFRLYPGKGGYLVYFSRIAREKHPEVAIEVARRSGIPLKMAGKVDKTDLSFFTQEIEPLLNHPLIEYLGEIHDAQRPELIGNAMALLFPIDWPEPFGLVMIEAMACGTPVIARPYGSVPEVVDDGVTGFIVSDINEMVDAVEKVGGLDRKHCLRRARDRFSAPVMADRYEQVYQSLIEKGAGYRLGAGRLSHAGMISGRLV